MAVAFGRDALLDAFDQIGRAAALAGTKLWIAVYEGFALLLASNFRPSNGLPGSAVLRPKITGQRPG